jgi:periplasmic protein TonB
MANTLKEAEATLASNTPSASANPAAKSAPQPVALEIPVTINGAHTVEGSDKREPFSETTQTVLVFGHGSVVRIATSLVPGQLVFLTNEKTKKEVVCQVVKSKSGGSGSNYVELQFTEPSPGFWGLRMPTAPAAPAAPAIVPRPASATPPATPPTLSKPEPVLPKPVAPAAIAPPPAPPKPSVVLPPAPPKPQPTAPLASSPAHSSPTLSVPPSPQVAPPAPLSATPSAAPPVPPKIEPEKQSPANSSSPLHDYAKQIDALFTAPPPASTSHAAPAAPPEPKTIPPAPPSSEQLKLEAARLQAQLSSMLFTQSPSSSSSPVTSVPPAAQIPKPPASDVAKKVVEIAHGEPKSAAVTEHKPAQPPARKAVAPPLSAEDEEVKMPSWLAPLSHESEPAVAEHHAPAATESIPELPPLHPASTETDSLQRPETAVFGGQLLGEIPAEAAESSSNGSKKGLFLGLVATIVLAGGGLWYFRPTLFGSLHPGAVKPASVSAASPDTAPGTPSVSEGSTAYTSSSATGSSAPTAAAAVPAVSQPSKTVAPTPSPAVMATPARSSPAVSHNNSPAQPEEPPKSPLGEVHLGAPTVSHEANATPSADTPSIDAHEPNSGADTLPTVAVSSHQEPAAPLPIGGDVHQAQLIKSVPPVYPAVAKAQHISGSVQVDALIDTSGNVAELRIISGPSLLHRAAIDAVKQWKYKPAMLDGQPTSMHLVVTVQFHGQ